MVSRYYGSTTPPPTAVNLHCSSSGIDLEAHCCPQVSIPACSFLYLFVRALFHIVFVCLYLFSVSCLSVVRLVRSRLAVLTGGFRSVGNRIFGIRIMLTIWIMQCFFIGFVFLIDESRLCRMRIIVVAELNAAVKKMAICIILNSRHFENEWVM